MKLFRSNLFKEWGSWGKCDEHCGPNGRRKRFRDCINTCDNKKNDDSKCKPFFNNIQKRNYTSIDVTECTPCPASGLVILYSRVG